MKTKFALTVLFCVFSTNVPADAENCINVPTVLEGECYKAHVEKLDKVLSQLIKRLLVEVKARNEIPFSERKNWAEVIQKTHTAWLRYRHLECDMQSEYKVWGGNGVDMAAGQCKIRLTKDRIRDVQEEHHLGQTTDALSQEVQLK